MTYNVSMGTLNPTIPYQRHCVSTMLVFDSRGHTQEILKCSFFALGSDVIAVLSLRTALLAKENQMMKFTTVFCAGWPCVTVARVTHIRNWFWMQVQ